MPVSLPIPVFAAGLLTLMACAPRPESMPAPPPQPPSPALATAPATSTPPQGDSPSWVTVDSAARTVTLTLEVTAPRGAASALINGYRAGEARVVVPLGWTVAWDWHSADSTAPHSLVVMVEREKIPLEGGRPAFSNAMTRMVASGLEPGQSDHAAFVVEEAGWFWMLCGVPDHALKGEWIELRVDPEAKTAGLQIQKLER